MNNLRVRDYKPESYIVTIDGGYNNGHEGNWNTYLIQINHIVETFKVSIIDFIVDNVDDVWTLIVRVNSDKLQALLNFLEYDI